MPCKRGVDAAAAAAAGVAGVAGVAEEEEEEEKEEEGTRRRTGEGREILFSSLPLGENLRVG